MKLWRGPQHVVEHPAPNVDVEYKFTRDWRGNKIIHGPHVIRIFDGNAEHLDWVEIGYYRQGERLNWVYNMADVPSQLFEGPDGLLKYGMMFNGVSAMKCWMSEAEESEFAAAIAREQQRPPHSNKSRLDREESPGRRRQHGFTFPGDTG